MSSLPRGARRLWWATPPSSLVHAIHDQADREVPREAMQSDTRRRKVANAFYRLLKEAGIYVEGA
jgi:hypothetical protein